MEQQARRLRAPHSAAHRADALSEIETSVRYGLATFTDSFLDALGGDFLADTGEAELRKRHSGPELARRLAANSAAVKAQKAVHALYGKLIAGAAMTIEEHALADHARHLAESHIEREVARRCEREGL